MMRDMMKILTMTVIMKALYTDADKQDRPSHASKLGG